jgi:hypothetical protein
MKLSGRYVGIMGREVFVTYCVESASYGTVFIPTGRGIRVIFKAITSTIREAAVMVLLMEGLNMPLR